MTFFDGEQQVLFVDDDAQLRAANVQLLELASISVQAVADAEGALAVLDRNFPGVLVSDIRMPRIDGLQLFARVRAIDPEIPVILITGHADVPMAVNALRDGAFDFLTKPFAGEHLVTSIRRALEMRRLVLDNRRLKAAMNEGDSPLIGDSAAMSRIRDVTLQLARADIDVLVEGETGTGKELVALLLHRKGPRRGRPFIPVNCGALPASLAEIELFGHGQSALATTRLDRIGRIEASHGGTLFLDEIDSTRPGVQAKLLRVLEEREVLPIGATEPRAIDLRVVAATKSDLTEAIVGGRFRQDLYYRLNVVRLRLPPLRERREDIPQLFSYFVEAAKRQVGLSTFTMDDFVRRRLLEHDWPGNVRELRNFAFEAVLGLSDTSKSCEVAGQGGESLTQRVERFEAMVIREALEASRGEIASTMQALGLPRKTLYDKLARHGIEPRIYRKDNALPRLIERR
ncbi:sigma-54-dependent transcriptional regulator [Sphingobium rhizovicinum]|uniref:Sigma-54-dependent transcriptional regulator n=1 Tax=Sphingobium rhizovicinum TaxID=432308 RepID=A0ABV7NJQ4_9SPHN